MSDAMRAETVTLDVDGDEVEAYLAQPLDGGPFGGVVVIHHMPGFDDPTKEIVRHFAAVGFLAICPNLYSREAPGKPPQEASAIVRAAGGEPDDRLVTDVAASAEHLRSLPGSNGKVGVIGYCSGGRHAFLAACSLPFDAAVNCYGGFVTSSPPPESGLTNIVPVSHLAPGLSCPLLGLFGAQDPQPSPDDVAELRRVLTEAGKDFQFHTYEDAGHAFFAVHRTAYRPEAAMDGWQKVEDFFTRHLSTRIS